MFLEIDLPMRQGSPRPIYSDPIRLPTNAPSAKGYSSPTCRRVMLPVGEIAYFDEAT